MSDFAADKDDPSVALELVVDKLGSGGVEGLTPTAAVRDASAAYSPPRYLDWADLTFKTAAWATKYKPMLDVERGHYTLRLDLAALGRAPGDKLSVEYHVDGGSTIKGDDSDLILVTNVEPQVTLLRKALTNRLEEASGGPGQLVLFDDDGSTPLRTWPLRDEFGGAILPTTGTPARRGQAT